VRNAYEIVVRKSEGKRLSDRFEHIWKDNIKMDIRKVGYEDSAGSG
jgi:hypothetical protein